MHIKKTGSVVVIVATLLATNGCLTSEFWNCCLFGQVPAAQASETDLPQDLRLPGLTRNVVTPAMSY